MSTPDSRPRIALVTPSFPLRQEPYRGQPIYKTALALRSFADIEAFCPIAHYPRGLQPRSYRFIAADSDWSPDGIQAHYAPYLTIPWVGRYFNGVTSGRAITPALRRFRPQLILSYWVYPEGFGAIQAARQLNVPVIVGARGSDLLRIAGRLTRQRISQSLSRADAVLTVSAELSRAAIALGAHQDRIYTIANGCDTSVFQPADRSTARARLGLPKQGQIILYVGHLIITKGLRELVEAFSEIARRNPSVRLVCIGEGALGAELALRATTTELAGRLLLPGAATPTQVAQWMASCDVLCLPSYSEGCPNAVLEALCCGRPVVASAVGAIPDLVSTESGRLAPARNAAALRSALEQALALPWEPESIARHSQRSWDDVGRETFAVCARLLARCGG